MQEKEEVEEYKPTFISKIKKIFIKQNHPQEKNPVSEIIKDIQNDNESKNNITPNKLMLQQLQQLPVYVKDKNKLVHITTQPGLSQELFYKTIKHYPNIITPIKQHHTPIIFHQEYRQEMPASYDDKSKTVNIYSLNAKGINYIKDTPEKITEYISHELVHSKQDKEGKLYNNKFNDMQPKEVFDYENRLSNEYRVVTGSNFKYPDMIHSIVIPQEKEAFIGGRKVIWERHISPEHVKSKEIYADEIIDYVKEKFDNKKIITNENIDEFFQGREEVDENLINETQEEQNSNIINQMNAMQPQKATFIQRVKGFLTGDKTSENKIISIKEEQALLAAGWTEEDIKSFEKQKKHELYINRTSEQKAEILINRRKKYANMSPEEKTELLAKQREFTIKRLANMSPEEKDEYFTNKRKYEKER